MEVNVFSNLENKVKLKKKIAFGFLKKCGIVGELHTGNKACIFKV